MLRLKKILISLRRHVRLHHWRYWWQHDVIFRRKYALLRNDLFSFDRRYWLLRALVDADQRRGKL